MTGSKSRTGGGGGTAAASATVAAAQGAEAVAAEAASTAAIDSGIVQAGTGGEINLENIVNLGRAERAAQRSLNAASALERNTAVGRAARTITDQGGPSQSDTLALLRGVAQRESGGAIIRDRFGGNQQRYIDTLRQTNTAVNLPGNSNLGRLRIVIASQL